MSMKRRVLSNSGNGLLVLLALALAALLLPLPGSAQIQTVCIDCHELLTGPGGLQVRPWRESIHAAYGISCHNCHGGDPDDSPNSMSPDRGFIGTPKQAEIPALCGSCHVGIAEEFLRSAHGEALVRKGLTCVTCHGSHGVRKASLELINEKSCTRCHSYERAAEIKGAMEENEGVIAATSRRIWQVKGTGVDTETLEKELYATRNSYRRLFHDLDVSRVIRESGRIRGELDRINGSLDKIGEMLRKRSRAGYGVVGLPLLAALLCYLLRKSYD